MDRSSLTFFNRRSHSSTNFRRVDPHATQTSRSSTRSRRRCPGPRLPDGHQAQSAAQRDPVLTPRSVRVTATPSTDPDDDVGNQENQTDRDHNQADDGDDVAQQRGRRVVLNGLPTGWTPATATRPPITMMNDADRGHDEVGFHRPHGVAAGLRQPLAPLLASHRTRIVTPVNPRRRRISREQEGLSESAGYREGRVRRQSSSSSSSGQSSNRGQRRTSSGAPRSSRQSPSGS